MTRTIPYENKERARYIIIQVEKCECKLGHGQCQITNKETGLSVSRCHWAFAFSANSNEVHCNR